MEMAMAEDDAVKVVALDTKVGALDNDVKQINARIGGLETKFDNVANSLAHEFREGLQSLARQISERGSTKWSVVFAGMTVATSVLGLIGSLAWFPISNGLAEVKADIRRADERAYNELQKHIDQLTIENRALRKLPPQTIP
jgi:hypothetical protein